MKIARRVRFEVTRTLIGHINLCARLLICSALFLPVVAHSKQAGTHTSQQLVEKLRQGGYIMYVRHAATDHSQSDTDVTNFKNCKLQRNLSEQGKQESRELGAAISALGIKIGKVISSPYCRNVDTAKIAFGRHEVATEMQATFFTDETTTRKLLAYLRSELSKQPEQGVNTVLVGHTANLRDVTRVWPKPEGVTHVFRPLGDKGFEHLGRIVPTEWKLLAGSQ